MDQLDIYYRALLDYRKQTLSDNKCGALRAAIANADTENDKLVTVRYKCTIEQDWVEAIEAGLVHIEKAIKEERQFIRSNGEVIPIEKVKHVSKETVEHLAKHSSLITRYEEGEDIIPDKLYTVERLSDYAVYENRFLYMLLCYLRDFITLRYNDILDYTHKYDSTVEFNKDISTGKERLTYSLSMRDVRRDDPYLKANNPARAMIDRIDLILKAVLAFLATPLMEEVGKTPMLKPPITKTNVLKMNNNFKGAMALYDYIIAYDKAGYTIEKEEKVLAPFRDDLADELAEAGGLVSFIAYEYGLGIKAELKEAYNREEERRKAERIAKQSERIARLKRRLENSQVPPEEYIVELENQLRDLEGEAVRAEALADELDAEKEKERALSEKISELNGTVDKLNSQMEEQAHRHFEELRRIAREHEDAMHDLIVKHEEETASLIASHNEAMEALREEARQERDKHFAELDEVRRATRERIDEIKTESDAAVKAAESRTAECASELTQARKEYDILLEEKRVAEARIKGLCGVTEDHTDRERFNELEREYNAFTRVYKEQWEKTKKQIKKNHLNKDNLKTPKKEKKKGKEKK